MIFKPGTGQAGQAGRTNSQAGRPGQVRGTIGAGKLRKSTAWPVGGDSRIYFFGIYFFDRNYLFIEDLLTVSRF
jgi:hypothetical protein